MFRKFCFLLLLPVVGYSQSLDVSVENASGGNQYSTFLLSEHTVAFSGNAIRFANSGDRFSDFLSYGVAPDYSIIGVLQNRVNGARSYLLDTDGDTLASHDIISLGYDDPSLAIYPLNSGSYLIRNNIANFTLYNTAGSITASGSGSSQSEEGESISEVAMDEDAKTVLIYTPQIKRASAIGSQAMILKENNRTVRVFSSQDREITFGGVSDDGQFIVLITAKSGTDEQAIILDRFGNEVNRITSDENLIGAYMTDDNEHITLYSSRRALVYSTLSGERLGSTSFRSTLIRAEYFPDDNTIVAVTGNKIQNTDIIKDLEFHAINLEQREIAREELSGALGTKSGINLKFRRTGSGRYQLKGFSRVVNLQASF